MTMPTSHSHKYTAQTSSNTYLILFVFPHNEQISRINHTASQLQTEDSEKLIIFHMLKYVGKEHIPTFHL